MEEMGLFIVNVKFVYVVNIVMWDEKRLSYYIIIFMCGELSDFNVLLENLELEKCDGWEWVEWFNVLLFVFCFL